MTKSNSIFNGKTKSDLHAHTIMNNTNLIGTGTSLIGDITCNADLRIDGTLTGNVISSAKVTIGANGLVEGDISGQQADIPEKFLELLKLKIFCN